MKLDSKQVALLQGIARAHKENGLRLTREAQDKLNQACKSFKHAAEIMEKLADNEVKPDLHVIEGGKDEPV